MSEKEKFSARLNEIMDDAGYPESGNGRHSAIAQALDVSVSSVGLWLDGLEYPKTSELVKMAQLLKVQSNWLLSGTGNCYIDDDAEAEYKNQLQVKLTEKKRHNVVKHNKTDKQYSSDLHYIGESGLSVDALALACDYMTLNKGEQKKIRGIMSDFHKH
ncbi:hypothetical protein MNBD_GAMMA12-123 [hydrothermal vent metagenome]|uniref:HTH cro/C1-type domain-containing protein n=1 Tax=hydrothermal vent metagenome TaxID=652676 RepID=A0A3B0YG73_9ZZZZ